MGNSMTQNKKWQEDFVANVLPTVQRVAGKTFGRLRDAEEKIADAVASAWENYYQARQQGKQVAARSVAYFAVQRTKVARRVGRQQANRDCFGACNVRKRQGLTEALLATHKQSVPDAASFRVDFVDWLATYDRHQQAILLALARGDGTNDIARRFNLTAGRISQMRSQFHNSWQQFHAQAAQGILSRR